MTEQSEKIYVMMATDYRLIAVYTDVDKCRAELPNIHHAFWVGVFPNNCFAETVPMWDRDSFLRNTQHGE